LIPLKAKLVLAGIRHETVPARLRDHAVERPEMVTAPNLAAVPSPFYRSPQADAGYDVADYRAVDPLFGTLEDFDRLLQQAHAAGLRVIVDLVPNHTSDEHAWFRAAASSRAGSPERARYIFRDGRGADGEQPPNDWKSVFGGSAWSRVPGDRQWYLHLFDHRQPDLNWEHPEVRAELESVLRF